jgi:hypothetical protein
MEQLGRLVVYRDLEAGVLGASRFTGGLAVLLAAVWLVALVRAAGHVGHPRSTLLAILPLASWAFASAAGGVLGAAARHPIGGATAVVLSALAYAWDARPGAPGVRTLTLGGLLAVPMLGGAGLLLQHAFDATEDAGPAASRTVVAPRSLEPLGAAAVAGDPQAPCALTRGRFSTRHRALGFVLSRLFLDLFVHADRGAAVAARLRRLRGAAGRPRDGSLLGAS